MELCGICGVHLESMGECKVHCLSPTMHVDHRFSVFSNHGVTIFDMKILIIAWTHRSIFGPHIMWSLLSFNKAKTNMFLPPSASQITIMKVAADISKKKRWVLCWSGDRHILKKGRSFAKVATDTAKIKAGTFANVATDKIKKIGADFSRVSCCFMIMKGVYNFTS